jgi:hypothetical protein
VRGGRRRLFGDKHTPANLRPPSRYWRMSCGLHSLQNKRGEDNTFETTRLSLCDTKATLLAIRDLLQARGVALLAVLIPTRSAGSGSLCHPRHCFSSFPRRRESSEGHSSQHLASPEEWMPACAGMTQDERDPLPISLIGACRTSTLVYFTCHPSGAILNDRRTTAALVLAGRHTILTGWPRETCRNGRGDS